MIRVTCSRDGLWQDLQDGTQLNYENLDLFTCLCQKKQPGEFILCGKKDHNFGQWCVSPQAFDCPQCKEERRKIASIRVKNAEWKTHGVNTITGPTIYDMQRLKA